MMLRLIFFTLSVLLTVNFVNSRVFYVDTPNNNDYSVNPVVAAVEQASKNLDMTFSAEDSDENDDSDIIYPIKKEFPYPLADGSIYDRKHPIHYRVPDIPARNFFYGAPYVYKGKNRKLLQGNDSHNGELVLELRVIANNKNGI